MSLRLDRPRFPHLNPSRILYVALAAAIGAAAGIVLARGGALRAFENAHRSRFGPLPLLGLELVVLWAVISAHEAGHLLCATLAGFKGLLYVSGPIQLNREDRGWKLRLNRNLALYGGIVSALPQGMQGLRWRMLAMVAGGPASSLLTGGVAYAVAGRVESGTLVSAAVSSFALVSLAIGIVTLVPARTIGFLTDGAQLVRLARGGPEVERDNAVMCLVASSYAGARPREWDPAAFAAATRPSADPRERITAARYAYMRAVDDGRLDDARALLSELLSHRALMPLPIQAMVLVNAAYFAARYDRDVATARARLATAREIWRMPDAASSLVDAAIAIAEGAPARVEPSLATARAMVEHSIDRGGRRVALEMIDDLRSIARAM